jgi:hypothetical protein
MTRDQRFRSEMFVRVRGFGETHREIFPESSAALELFAEVGRAVDALDAHMTSRVHAQAVVRRVKTETRRALFDYLKTMALVGRRVTRAEPGVSPFRLPRRRSVTGELATARSFIEEGSKRRDGFVHYGLPPTFVDDLQVLADRLQQAVDVRLNGRTAGREARSGIRSVLEQGLETIRDLDAMVATATTRNTAVFAAWRAARHIDGINNRRTPRADPRILSPATGSKDQEATHGIDARDGTDL